MVQLEKGRSGVGVRAKELLEVIGVTVYIAGTWERRGRGGVKQ